MIFLIDQDNPAAQYFLQSGIVFAICVSMLCFIFAPVVRQQKSLQATPAAKQGNGMGGKHSRIDIARRSQFQNFSLRDRGVHVSGVEHQSALGSALYDPWSGRRSGDDIDCTANPLSLNFIKEDSGSSSMSAGNTDRTTPECAQRDHDSSWKDAAGPLEPVVEAKVPTSESEVSDHVQLP